MYKDSSTLSFFRYSYFGKAHISPTFAVHSFIFNANFYQKDKVAMLLIPVLLSGSSKDFSLYTLIHFFRQLDMGSFHLRICKVQKRRDKQSRSRSKHQEVNKGSRSKLLICLSVLLECVILPQCDFTEII